MSTAGSTGSAASGREAARARRLELTDYTEELGGVREWSTSATFATAYVLPTAGADTDTTGMCTGQHELQADARG